MPATDPGSFNQTMIGAAGMIPQRLVFCCSSQLKGVLEGAVLLRLDLEAISALLEGR